MHSPYCRTTLESNLEPETLSDVDSDGNLDLGLSVRPSKFQKLQLLFRQIDLFRVVVKVPKRRIVSPYMIMIFSLDQRWEDQFCKRGNLG